MIRIDCMATFEMDADDINAAEKMLSELVAGGLITCDSPEACDASPLVRVVDARLGMHVPRPSVAYLAG